MFLGEGTRHRLVDHESACDEGRGRRHLKVSPSLTSFTQYVSPCSQFNNLYVDIHVHITYCTFNVHTVHTFASFAKLAWFCRFWLLVLSSPLADQTRAKSHQLLDPGGFVSFDWPCTSFTFKTSASRTWLRMDGARNYFNILVNGSGLSKFVNVDELGNNLKRALKRIFGHVQVRIQLNKSCRATDVC